MNLYFKLSELYWNRKYTNEHLKGNNRSYQKFILLTYKRSGSNFFMDLFKSHPQIVTYGGIFGERLIYPYPGYPPADCKSLVKFRDKYPADFMKTQVFRNFNDNVKAVGCKISYEIKYPQVLDYLRGLPDLKVINLQRRNFLEMHLSNIILGITKKSQVMLKDKEARANEIGDTSRIKFIEKAGDPALPPDFKVELDYIQCRKEFEKISSLIDKYHDFFNREQVLVVYYEDLLKDLEGICNGVQDFLGVARHPLKSDFIKINTRKQSEIISNYEELKKSFSGTQWASFFQD